MSPELYVFFGQAGGNGLLRWQAVADDDGVAIDLLGETAPLVPASVGAELVASACYLALTWSMTVTLRVTPIVDGVALDGTGGTADCRREFTLLSAATRQSAVYEMALTRPLFDPIDPLTEVARFYLRGTSIALRVETVDGLGAGDLILDRVDLEVEELGETLTPVG